MITCEPRYFIRIAVTFGLLRQARPHQKTSRIPNIRYRIHGALSGNIFHVNIVFRKICDNGFFTGYRILSGGVFVVIRVIFFKQNRTWAGILHAPEIRAGVKAPYEYYRIIKVLAACFILGFTP